MKLPQECPSCKVDLSDNRAPAEYADQFSLVGMNRDHFKCPVCRHVWPREEWEAQLRREEKKRSKSGNPARRRR